MGSEKLIKIQKTEDLLLIMKWYDELYTEYVASTVGEGVCSSAGIIQTRGLMKFLYYYYEWIKKETSVVRFHVPFTVTNLTFNPIDIPTDARLNN